MALAVVQVWAVRGDAPATRAASSNWPTPLPASRSRPRPFMRARPPGVRPTGLLGFVGGPVRGGRPRRCHQRSAV